MQCSRISFNLNRGYERDDDLGMYLKTLLIRIQLLVGWFRRYLSGPVDSPLRELPADTDDPSESLPTVSLAELSRPEASLTSRVLPDKSASPEITVKLDTSETTKPADTPTDLVPDGSELPAKEVEDVGQLENLTAIDYGDAGSGDTEAGGTEAGDTETINVERGVEVGVDTDQSDGSGPDSLLVGESDPLETADVVDTESESAEPENVDNADIDLTDSETSTADGEDRAGSPIEEKTEEETAEEQPVQIPDELLILVGEEQMPLTTMLESLLFVAEKPTEPGQFAKVLALSVEQIEAGLLRLTALYKAEGRGIRVLERNGRYVLVTMPAVANTIETFLNLDLSMKLSGPALEALAIVAYRQPATRQQIESVRGVDCGHVLRVLLQHGLIEEVGRLEAAGRPILYGVTDLFMQHFGLTSLGELPKLEITEADLLWATTEIAEDIE